jgi:uncharacterized membrane protein YcjF (UPF0283 family)
MSEHQKDTEFLRCIIVYADTEEHRELDRRIAQIQRNERCVKRVALGAVLFALAAMVGLAYVEILEGNFPYNESQLLSTVLCDLGLASLICLVEFVILLMVYRRRLNKLREECRQSVKKLVEFHLDKSRVAARPNHRSEPADRETAGTRQSAKL